MTAYAITTVTQPGLRHVPIFHEMGLALESAVRATGRDVVRVDGHYVSGRTNIVLGPNPPEPPEGSILYNLEAVFPGSPFWTAQTIALHRRHTVWDYRHANIAALRTMGIRAAHLPIGYVPELRSLRLWNAPDIDVLFYGNMNPRRQVIVAALVRAGVSTEVLLDAYGDARDRVIEDAKIVVNIHYWPKAQSFEAVRVSYLVANGVFVVSEDSASDDEEAIWREHGVVFAPYAHLVDTCLAWLGKDKERRERAEMARQRFEREPLVDKIAPLLAAYEAPSGRLVRGVKDQLARLARRIAG